MMASESLISIDWVIVYDVGIVLARALDDRASLLDQILKILCLFNILIESFGDPIGPYKRLNYQIQKRDVVCEQVNLFVLVNFDLFQKNCLGIHLDFFSHFDQLILRKADALTVDVVDDVCEDFVDLKGYLPNFHLESVIGKHSLRKTKFRI